MKYFKIDRVLGEIKEGKIKCTFEDRPKKYKIVNNYGDIPGMYNKADGDPWDVFAPGYERTLPFNKMYKVKSVIGVLLLEDGNHKIAVRLNASGYDPEKGERDINKYCKKYLGLKNINGYFIK